VSQPHNLIAGSPAPAARGGTFPGEDGSAWPRSTAPDVAAALAAGRACKWSARSAAARRRVLARAALHIAREPDPRGRVAAALGLTPRALGALHDELERELDEAVQAPAVPRGPRLFLPHWSGLPRRTLAPLLRLLASGDPLTWIVDPHLPELAAVAPALFEAGLEPGALSVLHDDGDTALRAALASGGYAHVWSSGPEERGERIAQATRRPCAAEAALRPFGAGVLEARAAAHTHEEFTSRAAQVARADDPEHSARAIARAAFDPELTLGGELPDSVGRVHVHPRRLSRFTAALLAALEERASELGAPRVPRERATAAALGAARDLGLDEGATLIHEDAGVGSRRAGGGAILVRLVFTNVEPHMRVAALRRPMPLLSILRGDDRQDEG
jgi:acyl-CoA reductase-like NAD-dependent aldehyde dehydrogenase